MDEQQAIVSARPGHTVRSRSVDDSTEVDDVNPIAP
jgi:hypothetical protein